MTFNKVSALFDEKFVACGGDGGSSGGSSSTCICGGSAYVIKNDEYNWDHGIY